VLCAAVETGGGAELQAASANAELTDRATRTVEDNLVIAVVVDVDKVCLPTARGRICARLAFDANKLGAAHAQDDCATSPDALDG
jgi:hypothetical protein